MCAKKGRKIAFRCDFRPENPFAPRLDCRNRDKTPFGAAESAHMMQRFGQERDMEIGTAGSAAANAIQGMKRAEERVAKAAENIVTAPVPEAADIVELITAEIQFKASAATLVAADEMTGALLDIKT